ncbi:O-antigen ligase family protein [uncultured Winogradskyella sp.]|uniref:O-antigen ligase family protein n=1 Tax=uncultured Winogradskyella sp. TaxID=395353 RepID=UPI0026205A5C|nr:O-antigen ligase family protein [uncultured Winogradskyella sp.]
MNFNYPTKIVAHILLGIVVHSVPFVPRIFFFGVIGYFLFQIISVPPKKKTIAVLKGCAYVVGAEILFRMTHAGLFYESAKYFVILFMLIGMYYRGLSNGSYPYVIFLFLLIPSIVIASSTIGFDSNLRTNVAFVLSGPICLGISALYCYDKKISFKQLLDILLYLGLPIVSLTAYVFLYTVSLEDIFRGTASNFAASGGFGPNQVATILGLGMFIFSIFFFINSKNTTCRIINLVLFALMSYRGIITFSRGGVLTAILMIFAFLGVFYFRASVKNKRIVSISFIAVLVASGLTWVISSTQTSGLIDKRYANQDASGKLKEDVSAGRVDLFLGELEGFINEPFFGVGASGMKELRKVTEGRVIATHNELSRMLSEHGTLGIIMLLILIGVPLVYRINNRRNYFFYAFLVFWFATINHSAMRIAAPGFIYALALLNVIYEKRPIHRKRAIA